MNGPHMAFFGRLTQNPELRYTANNGTPYLTIRIAVNTYRGEEQNQETIFINATLWRGQAENAARGCARGPPGLCLRQVLVPGVRPQRQLPRLQPRRQRPGLPPLPPNRRPATEPGRPPRYGRRRRRLRGEPGGRRPPSLAGTGQTVPSPKHRLGHCLSHRNTPVSGDSGSVLAA